MAVTRGGVGQARRYVRRVRMRPCAEEIERAMRAYDDADSDNPTQVGDLELYMGRSDSKTGYRG
eukprot:4522287-Prymnesium_polylepis.1